MPAKMTKEERAAYQREYRARRKAGQSVATKEVSTVPETGYVLVRKYSGGVLADGTTNDPPIDFEAEVKPTRVGPVHADLPDFRSNVGGPVPKPSAARKR